MLSRNKGQTLAVLISRITCICIIHCNQLHPCFFDHPLDRLDGISTLHMLFFAFLIQTIFSRKKKRQFIHIQVLLLIIAVLPDEASVFSVFCNSRISDHITVFMNCVHIKNKKSTRIKIIIYQCKNILQIFFICQIIHTVTDTDHCTDCTIKFKVLHIL